MTIEERLKELILSRHGTVKAFARVCDIPYGTVDTILRRGIHKASITNIITICKTLGISTDELAHDRIVPVERKQPESVSVELSEVITQIKNCPELLIALDGVSLSENEVGKLVDGLEVLIEILRRGRK